MARSGRSPRVTIRDIASAAGLSVFTVSRALNDKSGVSDSTRRQVVEVAARMGYRPNRLAQGLRTRRTQTIGICVADIANPVYVQLIVGVEAEARNRGLSVIATNASRDADREYDSLHTLLEMQVDGVLLVPVGPTVPALSTLRKHHVPTVCLVRPTEDGGVSSVVHDDSRAARELVAHLLQRGRRRVLFVGGPPHLWNAQQRLLGYREAHAAADLPVDEALVLHTQAGVGGGYDAMQVAERNQLSFDSVFAFSDLLALEVMRFVQDAGRAVPVDISVVGCDDILFSRLSRPALTTARTDMLRMGQLGVEILSRMMQEHGFVQSVVLPTTMCVRESS